jgi:signal transduction histidine kinase/DNA-binding response OmpR family regulator/ligand-binding sensor domain-containing protein
MKDQFKRNIYIICIILLSISPIALKANDDQQEFQIDYHFYNKSNGITGMNLNPNYQDSLGFLWITANEGLYRFDGNKMELMLVPVDSIAGDKRAFFIIIHDDQQGHFWIGTESEWLVKFNPVTLKQKYIRWTNPPVMRACRFLQKDEKHFWITSSEGLVLFDQEKEETVEIIDLSTIFPLNTVGSYLHEAVHDPSGYGIWVGGNGGLYHYDPDTREITSCMPENFPGEKYPHCGGMTLDKNGKIWVGLGPYFYHFDPVSRTFDPIYQVTNNYPTVLCNPFCVDTDNQPVIMFGELVSVLDTETNILHQILPCTDPYFTFSSNVRAMIDHDGNVWFGSQYDGIARISTDMNPFHEVILPERRSVKYWRDPSPPYTEILSLHISEDNILWIGNYGLFGYDIEKDSFIEKQFPSPVPHMSESRWDNMVIDSRQEDHLWYSAHGGLRKYNLVTEECVLYQPFFYFWAHFTSLEWDSLGFLWGGGPGTGIVRLNPETGENFIFHSQNKNIPGIEWLEYVPFILKNSIGQLFFCNSGGLIEIEIIEDHNKQDVHIDKYQFKYCMPEELLKEKRETKNFVIFHGAIDQNDHFWMGTNNSGLLYFNPSEETVQWYDESDGLADNAILSLIIDDSGRVWCLTDYGFSCLDPSSERIVNFYEDDGLLFATTLYGRTDIGRTNVCSKDDIGNLYFATSKGIVYFNPDEVIGQIKEHPRVVFTSLTINHEPVFFESDDRIDKHITYLTDLFLDHKDRSLNLEYIALDLTSHNQRYNYRYKLEGFDDDWVDAGQRKFLSYSNIPPGNYILKVNASPHNQYYEENIASIRIHMKPHPLRSWWAYIGYGLVTTSIILTIFSLYLAKVRKEQSLELKHAELQKTKEIEQAKTNFFTNVSHEFRTPLTLIINPLMSLIKGDLKGEESQLYQMMLKNVRNLKSMIDQILDISKLDARKMKLQVRSIELVAFSRQILSHFNSMANTRNIQFDFHSPLVPVYVWVDPDKFEKILNNLLSNAFKFTPKGGKINVKIEHQSVDKGSNVEHSKQDTGYINITVEDTGIGISEDKAANIFNRFYQVDEGPVEGTSGTGIGLALVKEYVEMHGGRISLESQPGQGAKFIVSLPLGKEHLKDDEFEMAKEPEISEEPILSGIDDTQPAKEPLQKAPEEAPLILIVDDHPDMLSYISGRLKNQFRLLEAENGKIALDMAHEHVPDLVISDVMMPEMDGYELCHHLKDNHSTCHIPVILLTAKADKDSKLEGLGLGADDYIPKPFDLDLLIARSNNLIEQRIKLRKVFNEELLISKRHSQLGSRDEKLINKIIEVVETSIEDPELSVEKLGKEVGLSRTQLYRKLLALSNQKPTEFIRTIRLRKAAEMIQHDTGSISEIAYAVGFNNLSYFSESFKKQYGSSPKDFKSNKVS